MNIEYRFAKPDEYPAIASFLNDHWARDHIYVRSEPLFRWTFARENCWGPEGFSVAVASLSGEIVGVLGGIPFQFNHYGNISHGVWLANYVIREDCRRGPAALKLLGMMRQEPFSATVSFGINPATAGIYRALRGQVLPHIPRHIAVLPEAVDRTVELLRAAHPDWTNDTALELAERHMVRTQNESPAQTGDTIPQDWDQTNWNVIANATVGAVRDLAYLQWRYSHHPLFQYRVITVPAGPRTGLLVWRCELIHRGTADGRVPVDRMARILEFLPASEANAQALWWAFVGQIREAGALGADYYGFHGATGELLQRLGFPRASETDAGLFPSRFQPLDGKSGNILSAAFLPAGAPECTVKVDCPWYWTKSDSDQDRPN